MLLCLNVCVFAVMDHKLKVIRDQSLTNIHYNVLNIYLNSYLQSMCILNV